MGTKAKVIKGLILSLALGSATTVAEASKVTNRARIAHAKELLGGTYKKSVVRQSEEVDDVSEFLLAMTKKFLPKQYEKKASAVARAIELESSKHGFDPIFVMAVIQNESSFNPDMVGGVGEIGLMQIRPSTAHWIAKHASISFKKDSQLKDPVMNIRIGTAFLARLRDQFESHSRLYISAYNMGAKKVRDLVEDDYMPKDYVQAVMKRYVALYSAFSVDGSTEEQTKAAYARLRDVTRNPAQQTAAN